MDPVTHALVGGLVAKTVCAPRRRFWMLMFLGEMPDLDVLFGGLGPWAFWLHHRGITHSLPGVAIQAVLFAALFSKFDPGPFRQRLLHYSLPLLLHAFCDYLTSYGVPLLSPFSFREFSGDLVPAVTVVPLMFMAAGLYSLHRKHREGWGATRWMWMAWAMYLGFATGSRAYAAHLIKDEAPDATLVAGLMHPARFTAVVPEGPCCTYRSYRVNPLTGSWKEGKPIITPMYSPEIQASLASEPTNQFVKSIRWPVGLVIPEPDGGSRVDWGKMLFSARGTVRRMWTVKISSGGVILEEHRALGFWSPE